MLAQGTVFQFCCRTIKQQRGNRACCDGKTWWTELLSVRWIQTSQ